MWTFIQQSGWILRPTGDLLSAVAYSGRGIGKNNPNAQSVAEIGPIPCGIYRIGDPYDHAILGDYVLPLTPDAANEMFGRDDFFIHGDSIVSPGNASKGCIVAPLSCRVQIAKSRDRGLEVIAQERAVSA
jgi:hypothetical protein